MTFINKRLTYISTLPVKQQIAYRNYKEVLEEVKKCIELNNRILKLITHDLGKMFENTRHVWEQNMVSKNLSKFHNIVGLVKQT